MENISIMNDELKSMRDDTDGALNELITQMLEKKIYSGNLSVKLSVMITKIDVLDQTSGEVRDGLRPIIHHKVSYRYAKDGKRDGENLFANKELLFDTTGVHTEETEDAQMRIAGT